MTEQGPSAWLASTAEIFDDLGVEWTLVGALAANQYRATPRSTADVDTLVAYDSALVERLESAGYAVSVMTDEGQSPHLIRCHRGPESVDILLPCPCDRDDIRSIREAGVPLDRVCLDTWIAEWDLAERWSTVDD